MAQLSTPARNKAQVAFATAVMLLGLSAVATYLSIERLTNSEKWLVHTYEVQVALGNVDSAALDAERDRGGYVITGGADALNDFEATIPKIYQALQHLRELTKDNPEQQQRCARLEEIMARRIALLRDSVDLKKTNPQDQPGQTRISSRALPLAFTSDFNRPGNARCRTKATDCAGQGFQASVHALAVIVLMVAFILALVMFSVHYRLLASELDAREQGRR